MINSLGNILKSNRKKTGISVGNLCKILNESSIPVSEKTIYKWENNEVTPDLDVLKKLAKLYNTTMANFIEGNVTCQALDEWEKSFISFMRKSLSFRKILYLLVKNRKGEIVNGK